MNNDNHAVDSPVLSWEDPAEYRAFKAGFLAAHAPANTFESALVEELADAAWAWRRARLVEKAYWEEAGGSLNRGPAGIAQSLLHNKSSIHAPFFRYMQAAERRYMNALRAVERLDRKRTRKEQQPAGAAANSQAASAQPAAAERKVLTASAIAPSSNSRTIAAAPAKSANIALPCPRTATLKL